MKYVMRSFGTLFDQRMNGMFLKSFDPEVNDGVGQAEWCVDPADAIQFDNAVDGFTLWRTVSKVHPVRLTDGKPNRPLTAHTIEMIPCPERSEDGSASPS